MAGPDAKRANSEPAIRVEAVSKRYGRTLALDEVSFDVRDNELFALLGPERRGQDDADAHPVHDPAP